jgi:hypothetical protein
MALVPANGLVLWRGIVMRMKRTAKRIGVVAALAVGPLMLAASPAFAASIYQGSDQAYNVGATLYACDREEDGNGVYAEYWGNGAVHGFVWDGNGSQSGCGSASLSSLTSFKVCEDDWGDDSCSSRVYL